MKSMFLQRDLVVKTLTKFLLNFYIWYCINCTFSSTKNLRPDDGLIKKGRNMQPNNKKTIPHLVSFDLLLFITDI